MKPEFVKIGDKKYKINTDFRIALECNKIAEDETIGEYEKALAVIYKLYGDVGLDDTNNHDRLLELGLKYLLCGKEKEDNNNDEPDMDFEQDRGKIKASFFSVYKVEDVFSIKYMHWWDFSDYMNGLTEDCALNYARFVREYDISDIKDAKERNEWIKRKKAVALKKKQKPLTQKQNESAKRFMELAKLNERE